MSLSEKLEQAKQQRLIAQGVAPAVGTRTAERPEERPSRSSGLFDPITIEVPPVGLHPVAPAANPNLESTTDRCPSCHSHGRVDMVDLVGHRTHLTCERCGAMWQVRTDQPTGR